MLYPELVRQFEAARWNVERDIAWDRFDAGCFIRDNQDDSDLSAFVRVWFFEEQKHSLVQMEYLRRFRPDLVPSEAEGDLRNPGWSAALPAFRSSIATARSCCARSRHR